LGRRGAEGSSHGGGGGVGGAHCDLGFLGVLGMSAADGQQQEKRRRGF
jgi:hypothetical protein